MVHHVLHEVSSDIRTLLSFVTAVVGHSAMSHHARSGAGNHVRHASHRGSRSPAYRRTNRGRGLRYVTALLRGCMNAWQWLCVAVAVCVTVCVAVCVWLCCVHDTVTSRFHVRFVLALWLPLQHDGCATLWLRARYVAFTVLACTRCHT